jgi:Arc/MetJ-type ribon-helix-helix transcriptional regulator
MIKLMATLADSIQRLPQVLDSDRVKYAPYQQFLRGVREGLAPEVLRRIVHLPFQWRQSRDQLRDQYGSSPTAEQQAKIKDYSDASHRLREALEKLLEKLRNRSVEQQTLGEDLTFHAAWPGAEQAKKGLAQSVQILEVFSDSWRIMENPEQASGVPETFHSLFTPLGDGELASTLESLRNFQVRSQN